MIVYLVKKKIRIEPMRVPEPAKALSIKYRYEAGTNHLLPRLTINKQVFEGDNIVVDLSNGFLEGTIPVKVELLDGNKNVLRTYQGELVQHSYVMYGKKRIRPDMDLYIKQLEARIIELEEEGDVI